MNSERFNKVMRLFQEACGLPPDQRSALLDASCGEDDALRSEVEAMIAADEGSGDHHAPISVGSGPRLLADGLPPLKAETEKSNADPKHIGRYEVVRKIGEGGMGVVYLGLQEKPQRMVALKVLKAGASTEETLRRFEHEALILGWLQHPGIAQIYEADTDGTGPNARPFISMEYVEGQTLTQHVENSTPPMSVKDRLMLFVHICDAVAYAHQRGIIHRDLKPSNILVTDRNTDSSMSRMMTAPGSPKILDFGVARLLDSELQPVTLHTSAGQVVGTLAYMSPEQVSGDNHDVDTRSDVYALGIMLYEILAGQPPLELKGRPLADAARIICEEEPPPLGSMNRACRGDIETIVGKALAKDKERRYQSASELAEDIQAAMRGEPIAAKRDSALYLLRKTVGRHRFAVATAFAFLLLVTGSAVALAVMYHNERAASARATLARDEERAARSQAEAVTNFLQSTLASVDPLGGGHKDIKVRDILDASSQSIKQQLEGQPRAEIAVRKTLGFTYLNLGEYAEAETHMLAAYEIAQNEHEGDHEETAECLEALARVLKSKGNYPESEAKTIEAIEIRKRLGSPQTQILDLQEVLAGIRLVQGSHEEAARMHRDTLSMKRQLYGPRHAEVATTLNDLAACLFTMGRLDDAEVFHREALSIRREVLGRDHFATAASMKNLGVLLQQRGDIEEAEKMHRGALAIHRRLLPPEHPSLTGSMSNLATILQDRGRFDEAEALLREALTLQRRSLPSDHPTLGTTVNNLAQLLSRRGDIEGAEPLAREALDIARAKFGEEHAHVGRAMLNYGTLLIRLGRMQEAAETQDRALQILRGALSENHPNVATAMNNLALQLSQVGEFDRARSLMKEARTAFEAVLGAEHPNVAVCIKGLGVIEFRAGDLVAAERDFREALEHTRRHNGPDEAVYIDQVVQALEDQQKLDEAEKLARESLQIRRSESEKPDVSTAYSLFRLGEILMKRGRDGDTAAAETIFRECLAIRTRELAPANRQCAEARCMLGAALLKLGRHAEAEPLLLQAYEDLDETNSKVIAAGLDNLIRLYEITGRRREADRWRRKLQTTE